MANLATFINECLGIATSNEVSSLKPIVLSVNSPIDGTKTKIVCAYLEPYNLVLPLNVTWIDSDPTSPDYKKAYKRSTKDPLNGLENTWEEVLIYEDIFNPIQFYDGTDLPTVESQVAEVQSAIDHTSESTIGNDVHGSKWYTDLKLSGLQNKVNNNTAKSANNYYLITLLQNKVTALEEQVAVLAIGTQNSLVHYEEVAKSTWVIPHNFGTAELLCQLYDKDNVPMLPTTMGPLDKNNWIVHLDIPLSGKAVVVGV